MKKKVKKGLILTGCLILILSLASWAVAAADIKVIVNGEEISFDQAPVIIGGRVLIPVRAVVEALGASISWDADTNTATVTNDKGDKFLSGLNDPTAKEPSIHSIFVTASALKTALDDDNDGDLCDYRTGHNGGDNIANDPLVVDVRGRTDYDAGHIPGAIFIASAQDMGKASNMKALRQALETHVANGGKNEVLVYCFTSHTAGLACGVLGANGFNVKNLRFGYAISWEGTKEADKPIKGPREDKDGKPVPYAAQ